MHPMRATCTSWSWSLLSFEDVARIMALLGFRGIDIGAFAGWAHFEPQELAANPRAWATLIRSMVAPYDMELTDLFVTFGPGLEAHCVNAPQQALRDENFETFKRLTEFCQAAQIPGITLCPGVEHPALGRQNSLELSIVELARLAQAGADAGIRVSFEPHVESVTESPAETLAVLKQVPHLRLTLDYSHFVYQGYKQAELEALHPYVAHFHIRQSTPGALQCRTNDGIIDFPRALESLAERSYSNWVAFEYVWEHWMDNDRVDVLSETLVLRRQLQRFFVPQS